MDIYPTRVSRPGRTAIAIAAGFAAAVALSASAALADGTHAKSPKLYDWHAAGKQKSETTRPARTAIAALRVGGSASYACSPSGSGKRAFCRRK